VPGFVSIFYNPSLDDLSLDALSTVGSYVTLYGNFVLADLSGIDSMTSIGGDLYISFNGDLLGVLLPQLVTVAGSLDVSHCALTSGVTLASLTSTGGLFIRNLDLLTQISLPNLAGVAGDFIIKDNINLATSQAEALRDQVLASGGIQGTISIEFNQ
jgi:hypothetical protein